MTKDERQVLKAILGFVAFKALLFLSINRSAKAAREMAAEYNAAPDLCGQLTVKTGTDLVGGHVRVSDLE